MVKWVLNDLRVFPHDLGEIAKSEEFLLRIRDTKFKDLELLFLEERIEFMVDYSLEN